MNYYIYTLEYNDVIFYVGKTTNPKSRLNKHIKESVLKRTHKEKKINKILTNNGEITLSVIDIVEKGMENYFEIYWISQIKSWGFDICNATNGGDGGDYWTGRRHKPETIDKLREIRKIYLLSNSVTKCLGESNGRSKLKSEDIIEMRLLRDKGYSYKKLSIKYCISKTMVINIIKRKKWKHI